MQVPEIDDVVNRIGGQKGVAGVIITTKDGMPIKTTLDNTSTVLYVGGMQTLEERCESLVRDIDPTNELTYLRITTKRFEIMMGPKTDHAALVIQNVNAAKM